MARNFFGKLGRKLIAAGMVLCGVVILLDLGFRPVIETANAYECHAILDEIINRSVLEELENENADYSRLVNLGTNPDGEVISVESNVMNINRLKTRVAQRIEREMRRISSRNIEIPVGTLLGIQFLHDKGFNVGMSVRPRGFATASIISEFTSQGLNQTLHKIVIVIEAEADAIIPGFSSRVAVKTSITAAETVIVGRVPDAYTHVVASESLSGYLNDYGAVQP